MTDGDGLTASERRAAKRRARDEAGEPRSMTGMWVKTGIGIALGILVVIVFVALKSPAKPEVELVNTSGDVFDTSSQIAIVRLWPNDEIDLGDLMPPATGETSQLEVRCLAGDGKILAQATKDAAGRMTVEQVTGAYCP